MEIKYSIEFVFYLFIFIFSGVIFFSYMIYKPKLSNQDVLICQKNLLSFLYTGFLICVYAFYFSEGKEGEQFFKSYSISEISNLYLITLYLFSSFISSDEYLSVKDPTYTLRDLITNRRNYFYTDLFIALASASFMLADLLLKNPKEKEKFYIILSAFFGSASLFTIIKALMRKKLLSKYESHPKKNQKKAFFLSMVLNFLYLILSVLLMCMAIYSEKLEDFEEKKNNAAMLLGFFDILIMMKNITYSSFFYYILGSTNMYIFFCWLGCNKFYSPPLFYKEDISYRTSDINLFMVNLYNNIGLIIDEQIIQRFDFLLNLTTSTLCSVYKRFNEEHFIFEKNKIKDDFTEDTFRGLPLSSINEDVSVEITSLFTNKIKEILNLYQISHSSISKSLASHKMSSLLSKNAKELYFKSLNNLCIKTYDKNFLIEIRSDVSMEPPMRSYIEKYINHIGKLERNTFLPILCGVFKVKINSFKEFVVFISKNPLVEDSPNSHYNFWQLMRFSNSETLDKISSSKEKDSFIVTTEVAFEKNPKFYLKDYESLNDTFKSDVDFLKSVHAKYFSVLVLYYEIKSEKEDSSMLINQSDFETSPGLEEGINSATEDIEEFSTISMISYKNESKSKISIMKNGYDSTYNGYNGVLYFSFENVFNIGNACKTNHSYNKYRMSFLNNFVAS